MCRRAILRSLALMAKRWLSMPGKGSLLKTRAIQTLTQENRRERLWNCLIVHAKKTKMTPSTSSFQRRPEWKNDWTKKALYIRVTSTTRHLQWVVRGITGIGEWVRGEFLGIVQLPGHDEDIAESKHDRYNILWTGSSCLNHERIEKRLLDKSGALRIDSAPGYQVKLLI